MNQKTNIKNFKIDHKISIYLWCILCLLVDLTSAKDKRGTFKGKYEIPHFFTRLKSNPLRNSGPESQRGATPVGSRRGDDDDDERQVQVREVRVRPDAPGRSAVPAGGGIALLAALGASWLHGGRRWLLPSPAARWRRRPPAVDRVRVPLRRHGQGHPSVTRDKGERPPAVQSDKWSCVGGWAHFYAIMVVY